MIETRGQKYKEKTRDKKTLVTTADKKKDDRTTSLQSFAHAPLIEIRHILI